MATICSGGQVERRSGPANGRRSEVRLRAAPRFHRDDRRDRPVVAPAVVSALTPPSNYRPELVDQFLFALRLGWFPMILASLAFTYGPAGIEVGNFLNHYPTGTRSRCPTPATAATADCSASSSSAT
jgi:hypothetical protein